MDTKIKGRKEFLINLAYFAAIALIVYLVFKYLIGYIMPFIIAFILVSIINPIIRKINSFFPKSRSAISIILMLFIYLVVAGLIFLLIFNLLIQLSNAAEYISNEYYPTVLRPAFNDIWDYVYDFIEELPEEWQEIAYNMERTIMSQIQEFLVRLAPNIMSIVTRFSSALPGFFIAFIFTVMLSFATSVQYEKVLLFMRAQLSDRTIKILTDLREIMGSTIFKYIRALLILMCITCVELIIGFSILGVENKLIIAIGIAALDAFPIFGTGTVLIPWVVVKLIQKDFKMALGLFIIYITITLMRQLVEPKIVGDQLGINPIVSFISIYAGYKTIGVFGMIIMPIVAQVLLELNRRGTIKLYKPVPEKHIEEVIVEVPEA